MDVLTWYIVVGILNFVTTSKVYEWKTDWGSSLLSRELAQVHDVDQTVIHYATDEGLGSRSAPAISLYDFSFTSTEFQKGIVAVRPVTSGGSQLCFITRPVKSWTNTVNEVFGRHGTVLSAPKNYKLHKLTQTYPDDIDPLSVQTIADFCSVDQKYVYYMDPVSSLKGMKRLKINGLFGRLTVGLPDDLYDKVFGFFGGYCTAFPFASWLLKGTVFQHDLYH